LAVHLTRSTAYERNKNTRDRSVGWGISALLYGHFEYTKETHEGQIGPIKFSFADKETMIIPSWASITVIVAGVVLLVINRK
jgi:hypothetical protein